MTRPGAQRAFGVSVGWLRILNTQLDGSPNLDPGDAENKTCRADVQPSSDAEGRKPYPS